MHTRMHAWILRCLLSPSVPFHVCILRVVGFSFGMRERPVLGHPYDQKEQTIEPLVAKKFVQNRYYTVQKLTKKDVFSSHL